MLRAGFPLRRVTSYHTVRGAATRFPETKGRRTAEAPGCTGAEAKGPGGGGDGDVRRSALGADNAPRRDEGEHVRNLGVNVLAGVRPVDDVGSLPV